MRYAVLALLTLTATCNRQTEIDLDGDDDVSTDSASDGDGDADGDADADGDSDGDVDDWVGLPCDPPAEEGDEDPCPEITGHENTFCFAWADAPGGFCTVECIPADSENPIDGCGMLEHDVVCMDISAHTADPVDDEEGYAICVEMCVATPTGGDPDCTADYIKCDPHTWSSEAQFATCLLPKCESDADCLTASGPECASDGDCLAENGETCSDDGLCVFEAACNTISGRCSWEGDNSAEIGDPCESSWDCGDNGICLTAPEHANGYCTREGCKAANSAAENGSGSADPEIDQEFGCGMLGSCQGFPGFGGLCLRRCAPDHSTDAFKCRQAVWEDEVLDVNGDYECIDMTDYGFWIPISGETMIYLVMQYPSCHPLSMGVKCGEGDYEVDPDDCDSYFGPFTTGLCRDPVTGEETTDGYCLDDTTSGPTESW